MSGASLRRTALGWMTALLAGIGIAAMLAAYVLARGEAADFLDGQLRQVALNAGPSLAERQSTAQAPPAADEDPEDQIAVTIWQEGRILRNDPGVDTQRPERLGYADAVMGGETWRTYTRAAGPLMVRVAQRDVVRAEFARTAALGAVTPLLLLVPLSWLVVGWAMNRVLGRLAVLVRDLAGRSVSAMSPLPTQGVPVEVVPLVGAMNGLIGRLQTALDAQSRFIADAAHELRTPLAAMQAQLDVLPASDMPGSRDALAAGLRRASRLVDQLLRLARLDGQEGAAERLDLAALLLDCVGDHAVLAQAKEVDLGVAVTASVMLHAPADEIRTLVATLLDNALRYTAAGGEIEVSLGREAEREVLAVQDTGCGLPPGSEARLFDRFYRAAPPDIEGTGLGLAIARRIAERHGLGLTVGNRQDGRRGVLARIVLPA